MTTKTRIYIVTCDDTDAQVRLVRASSAAAAIRHVVATKFRAEVADQDALVYALGNQVEVENASAKE